MPLALDIEATDNIIVNFDQSNEKKLFKITLVNKGKEPIKLKQIHIYSESVAVVGFDEKHAVIESGGQFQYLFEAEKPAHDSIEGRIRFSFHNRLHLTRSFKLIINEIKSVNSMECSAKNASESIDKTQKQKSIKKDETKTDQKGEVKVEEEIKNTEINTTADKNRKIEINNNVQNKPENKIQSVNQKLDVPKVENGLIPVVVSENSWIKEFRTLHRPIFEITDKLVIKFDRDQCDKSCEVVIRNNACNPIYLEDICIAQPTLLTVRGGKVACKSTIQPNDEIVIVLDAVYLANRRAAIVKVDFKCNLTHSSTTVRRSVMINYRKRGAVIQKQFYERPIELIEICYLKKHCDDGTYKQLSKTEAVDLLDAIIPPMNENYAEYFHILLHLEDIGLDRELKFYNQSNACFGDTDSAIRQKYPHGMYDLSVNELFEVRPALQVGDKLIVRKQSEPNISYEGRITALKETDLIVVEFHNDFVKTFDHTRYLIEFTCSRSYCIRQHFAIDMALELYGMDILLPKEISLRDKPILDSVKYDDLTNIHWFNDNLNEQQQQAVAKVIRGDLLNPYLIFGPPGTGKTTTLVEIVLQVLKLIEKSKILITTQSNSASNLITQRLIQSKQIDEKHLLRLISYNYSNRCNEIPDDIKMYSKTIGDLADDGMSQFQRLQCLKSYRVIIGTFAAISYLLEGQSLWNYFTHSVIDEAGQCTEIDALVPMALVGKRGQTIMAGDPMQMSPLVINEYASTRGLTMSMLSRLIECYSNINNNDVENKNALNGLLVSKLLQNYRALPTILDYTNNQFYKSELIAMIDAKTSHCAKTLKYLHENLIDIFPDITSPGEYGIHFINTNGRCEKRKTSWFNIAEVQQTRIIVERLMQWGLNEEDIGIITPYSLQLRALKKAHEKRPQITVGTIDDFQGLERKVILISTVRTCPAALAVDLSRRLGFVKCPKRINVATSRARLMLIVIGNAELLSHDENWQALIAGCEQNHTYINSINHN